MYTDYAFGQSEDAAYKAALEKYGGTVSRKSRFRRAKPTSRPTYEDPHRRLHRRTDPQSRAVRARRKDVAGIQQFGINKKLPIAGVGTREQFGGTFILMR